MSLDDDVLYDFFKNVRSAELFVSWLRFFYLLTFVADTDFGTPGYVKFATQITASDKASYGFMNLLICKFVN